jgi:hypothetical protein
MTIRNLQTENGTLLYQLELVKVEINKILSFRVYRKLKNRARCHI